MQTLNVHQDYQVGVIGRIPTLPKHGDIILKSTSQSREKWDSLVLCFYFCFLFRANGKRTTDGNNLRHYYGVFFETTILKLLDHSVAIRRHFDNGIWKDSLQLKILRIWINIGTTYFLSKFVQTKIDEKAWKTYLHNNPIQPFEEHCAKTFHLLLHASFALK